MSRIEASGSKPTHDLIVIGGGVNGTGVARDCALRGLRVALFEKHDLGFGASGNSSGMIHGGVRYLLKEPEVTADACRDSGYIQQIAPHLLFRIPFIFPIPAGGPHLERAKRSEAALRAFVELSAVDAFFAFYDRYQPLKRGNPHTRLDAAALARAEPGLAGDYAGAVTFDEWGVDGNRLCVMNALDARAHGGDLFLHHEVLAIERAGDGEGAAVKGVIARDRLSGARVEASAPVVVNATGAWSPLTAKMAGSARTRLRPGKGVHLLFDRRVADHAVITHAIDGREIFVMPWQNLSFIGTTDDDYFGELDDVRATTDEARYLMDSIAERLPEIDEARVIGTTAGVRPTLFGWGQAESALSREHEIVDHAAHGVPGFYSMIGGKLASYRLFAAEMSDTVAERLGVRAPCRTHELPMPGGESLPRSGDLAQHYGLPEPAVRRLVFRHGARALPILARIEANAHEQAVVCAAEPVLECEVRFVCQTEAARTLADVARRTRLGLGACGGLCCAHRGAQIVAEEWGYPPAVAHHMALRFLEERYRSRVVGLEHGSMAAEAMVAGRFLATGGLRRDNLAPLPEGWSE